MPDSYHIPVLVADVLAGLTVVAGGLYVVATVGGGGHARHIMAQGGRVIGIDQDEEALQAARLTLGPEVQLLHANFRDIQKSLAEVGIEQVDGILADLGVSSHQLDDLTRGFSFKSDILDMRMDPQRTAVTGADLVATLAEADLAQIFYDLGEERYGRKFAAAIVAARTRAPLQARALAEVIWHASPPTYRYGTIHPATRVFQALRLAVNSELPTLQDFMPQAANLLGVKGRLVVISFHSLEDRIVKHFIHDSEALEAVTRKPVMATKEEISLNPRARSAKLRVAQKRDPQ